jgi:DNA invertase Pin-like site-specific DNA recombinase
VRANDHRLRQDIHYRSSCGLFETQLKELESVKCPKIFREQTSSVAVRARLEVALEFVREGDVLVVTKLDRLARSVADLIRIIQTLERVLACGFLTWEWIRAPREN